MSETLSVTKTGYVWNGTEWRSQSATYISSYNGMTGLSFTPEKQLRAVSITLNVDQSRTENRYSLTKPTVRGDLAPGTDFSLTAGDNVITLSGTFAAGTAYTLWAWGTGGTYGALVRSCSGTGEAGGIAHIYNGSSWDDYIPYVYDGSSWEQVIPYVYDGSWEVMS